MKIPIPDSPPAWCILAGVAHAAAIYLAVRKFFFSLAILLLATVVPALFLWLLSYLAIAAYNEWQYRKVKRSIGRVVISFGDDFRERMASDAALMSNLIYFARLVPADDADLIPFDDQMDATIGVVKIINANPSGKGRTY